MNLLEPINYFHEDTGAGVLLTVEFVGGQAGWTLDPGDGSAPIAMSGINVVHTYTKPTPPGSVAVTAQLLDSGSQVQGQLTFAIPRPVHYPRQVAACPVGRADDYPPAV